MPINKVIKERFPAKIWASLLEKEAEEQIRNMAKLPFIFKHLAIMPDAHAGKGSTVGTVIATQGAIIPAAVGVDIGCGMSAVKLPFKIDDITNLPKLRSSIERSVPTGFHGNREVMDRVAEAMLTLVDKHDGIIADGLGSSQRGLLEAAAYKLGSLGGGNHFIEICGDEEGNAWIMLHSGSRNIGNKLAQIHMRTAKDLMKKFFMDEHLADQDLSFLVQGTEEFNNYIHDLHFAQDYAQANRDEMMLRVMKDVSYHVLGRWEGPYSVSLFRVDCHHNYSSQENHFGQNVWVTRKGAVRARESEYGIIPGSMGAKSYIVRGLGNPESFCSCSHGAGRTMSRTEAKRRFTKEDLAKQTEGVECSKASDIVDEIPAAYKDIDVVMEDQNDLVEPVHTLKQILCVKGGK